MQVGREAWKEAKRRIWLEEMNEGINSHNQSSSNNKREKRDELGVCVSKSAKRKGNGQKEKHYILGEMLGAETQFALSLVSLPSLLLFCLLINVLHSPHHHPLHCTLMADSIAKSIIIATKTFSIPLTCLTLLSIFSRLLISLTWVISFDWKIFIGEKLRTIKSMRGLDPIMSRMTKSGGQIRDDN